jgi:hypothetical protein
MHMEPCSMRLSMPSIYGAQLLDYIVFRPQYLHAQRMLRLRGVPSLVGFHCCVWEVAILWGKATLSPISRIKTGWHNI